MNDEFSTLSQRLKYALQVLNVSQTELARRINVKPQVIQYLSASQSQKSRFTCEISEALDIDFGWLATGKGPVPLKNNLANLKNSIPLLDYEQIRKYIIPKKTIPTDKVAQWITMGSNIKEGAFAVILNCRAMAPRFDLNTIIIIEPVDTSCLLTNSYVLVYLLREDYIIFRQLTLNNNKKYLIPINKLLHKEVLLSDEDIILGTCKEARWSV